MEIAEIVEGLNKGSEQALHMLYRLYAKKLFEFSMRYTKSVMLTEEIIEDVFIWVWKKRTYIKNGDTLEALLLLRTKHFLINSYRANLNSPIFMEYTELVRHTSYNEAERNLYYDDFRRQLENCIEQLPETQRKIIRLVKIQELKDQEAADQLNLSIQTIRNQLSIGLKTLRALLKKSMEPLNNI